MHHNSSTLTTSETSSTQHAMVIVWSTLHIAPPMQEKY
jgi:hypothetical protein